MRSTDIYIIICLICIFLAMLAFGIGCIIAGTIICMVGCLDVIMIYGSCAARDRKRKRRRPAGKAA